MTRRMFLKLLIKLFLKTSKNKLVKLIDLLI